MSSFGVLPRCALLLLLLILHVNSTTTSLEDEVLLYDPPGRPPRCTCDGVYTVHMRKAGGMSILHYVMMSERTDANMAKSAIPRTDNKHLFAHAYWSEGIPVHDNCLRGGLFTITHLRDPIERCVPRA